MGQNKKSITTLVNVTIRILTKKNPIMDQRLTIGWKAIGQATNRNPNTLAHAASMGTLPVTPQKLGNMVALTPSQVQQLKRGAK